MTDNEVKIKLAIFQDPSLKILIRLYNLVGRGHCSHCAKQ